MPTSPDELYAALEDFIMRLMTLAESDGMDAMVELDLSFSQARMLFLLAKKGEPMPIHSIAKALGLSDAATGRNVDQLLKLDVVERRESPDDRRVKLVSLTPAGEKLSMQHIDSKRESIKAFTADLPEAQRDDLHRAISDILAGDTLRRHTP
ncbi:MarR family winged helix-turn-helix transcriptional regulator [Aeromicrobium sp.]|uniref:MarR family winged helix-turn-helix transcriptional regulator n=1 Tax=Aeromicrobium sp. TaxID=1871063 RepID=UPI002FCBDAD8